MRKRFYVLFSVFLVLLYLVGYITGKSYVSIPKEEKAVSEDIERETEKEEDGREEVQKEKTEEEGEYVELSDSRFIRIYYGNMELSATVADDNDDDGELIPYKRENEVIIKNAEMAKEIAVSMLKPYCEENKGTNYRMWVQYIPEYRYYLIQVKEYASSVGYKIELFLNEQDGRVEGLWIVDGSRG